MKQKSAIGILGGMGPEASIYMYKTLIELSVSRFGAINNNDFPEILLQSIPVPDFISNEKEKLIALGILKKRVECLNYLDLSCLSIACNTAHVLLKELQEVSKVPFLSMIDEVIAAVKKDKRKIVGLLGTPFLLRSQLYQKKLSKAGIVSIVPDESDQKILEKIIRNVIANKSTTHDKKKLLHVSKKLQSQGAEAIILACTEIPVVFPLIYKIPVYNSVEILSIALLRRYYK